MSNQQKETIFRWSEVVRNWAVAVGPVALAVLILWLDSRYQTKVDARKDQEQMHLIADAVVRLIEQSKRLEMVEAEIRELRNRFNAGESYQRLK